MKARIAKKALKAIRDGRITPLLKKVTVYDVIKLPNWRKYL